MIRGKHEGDAITGEMREIAVAVAGLAMLAGGTYPTVRATENIAAAGGISKLVTSLFITAIIVASPELFATWSIVRSGQVTAGVTNVLGDHAMTMTVAVVPLALTTVPIEDIQLYT